jgi:hypothetical protein
MRPQLTPQDWETLSAYLDAQLAETEKRQIQDLMALRPELKQGLEDLRRTRAVLRAAPRRRAPRNFTLSAEMAHKARPRFRWGWTPSFSFASGLAAVLLVLSFFFRVNLAQISLSAPMAAQAPMALAQQSEAYSNTPPIITWNQPGYGGGAASAPAGAGAGDALDSAGKAIAPPVVDSQALPQDTPAVTETEPVPDQQPGLAAATVAPSEAPRAAAPLAAQSTSEAVTNATGRESGPILGIAPTEEQGRMFVPDQTISDRTEPASVDRWPYVQIGLAGFAVLFALGAFFTWRKAHH